MQVKFMSEKMLLKLITNNYMGDPMDGFGTDYHDYKDEIDQRYWTLKDDKALALFEQQIKQLDEV